ncbi:unnamed protein product [Calypogeia fissa]
MMVGGTIGWQGRGGKTTGDEVIARDGGGDIYFGKRYRQPRWTRRDSTAHATAATAGAWIVAISVVVILALMMSQTQAADVAANSSSGPGEQTGTSSYTRPGTRPNIGHKVVKAMKATKGNSEPTQVHISLNGPNHMHITWITKTTGNPSTVEYGMASGAYNAQASGTTNSYSYLLYKSGEIHDVVVGPLKDDTTYYYRLGGTSTEYTFKTPPPLGPEVPITFAVAGDLGQTGWTTTTLQHMKSLPYDLLIYSGDLSYADYYQPLWDSFGEIVSPLASQRPWMVTQGNHEKEYLPLIIEAFRSYNARWAMPFAASGSSSNLFYSFEVAACHILMLGSYAAYSSTSAQYKWIQQDLAKVDRKKTPWLIVVLHAPWYNSNTAHQGDGDAMQASIEPLLFAAKVDILFAGHVHAYERSTRVYQGVPNPLGIMHINIGDGGNREGLANNYINPQPVWSLYREASFGFGQLDIQSSTTARWVWHRNQDDADIVADEVFITSLSDPKNPAYLTATTGTSGY